MAPLVQRLLQHSSPVCALHFRGHQRGKDSPQRREGLCDGAGFARGDERELLVHGQGQKPAASAPVPRKDDAADPNPGSVSNNAGTTATASTSADGDDTPESTTRDASPSSLLFGSTSGADGDGYTSLELATATSFIEKVAGAIVMYGLTMLLANLSGVDATKTLIWDDGAPLALGAVAAVPAIVGIAALFFAHHRLGLNAQQLLKVSQVDQEEDTAVFTFGGGGIAGGPFEGDSGGKELPDVTNDALKQGLWFYQMHVLKPWFPAFEWSSVGFLYVASCIASSAQELLVRGYGGALLTNWYAELLAGTTDVNNPIYWAKVFKLVSPDTSRWLAALSLISLQVALSSASATRASRFTRVTLNRLGRVAPKAGALGMVENVSVTLEVGQDSTPKVDRQRTVLLEVPTAEERVVYWTSMAVSVLLCGATNCAWAASGSLLGSYTAQVAIDGVVTCLQQIKATRLPEKELWEEVQRLEDEAEDKEDGSDNVGDGAQSTKAADGTGSGRGSKKDAGSESSS